MAVAPGLDALVIGEEAVVGAQGVGGDRALPADGLALGVVPHGQEVEGVVPLLGGGVDEDRVLVIAEDEDLSVRIRANWPAVAALLQGG